MTGSAASALSAPLETRIVRRKLKDLKLLAGHENARYMKAAQFQLLVENLQRDRVLTSTPLVYRDVILSGNHRVQAGIKAGIEECDCIELLGDVSADRQLALQLSHNAINGEDDPNILATLWKTLPFEEKRYSGLTDDVLGKVQELDVQSLGIGGPAYEELRMLFLPDDAGEFTAAIKRIEKLSKNPPFFVADKADFDKLFDAIIAVKSKMNVHNTALAVKLMAQLALERIEQLTPPEDGPAAAA